MHIAGDVEQKRVTFQRISNFLLRAHSLTINNTELYFGVEASYRERLSYSLPPKPPVGAFDIRFTGDTRIASEETEIEVMSTSQSLTIGYAVVIDADFNITSFL